CRVEPSMDRDGPGAILQARRRPASREFSVGTLHQLSRKDCQSLRHLDPREVGGDATRKQSNHRMNRTALRAARYPRRSTHKEGVHRECVSFAISRPENASGFSTYFGTRPPSSKLACPD